MIRNVFKISPLILRKVNLNNNLFLRKKYLTFIYIQSRTISKIRNIHLAVESENKEQTKNTSKYTERTCTCGDLQHNNVGERVVLCGWVEYQRLNKFVVLRDGYGETQLILKDNDSNLQNLFDSLPYESVVKIEGLVLARPADMINKKQKTGRVEVLVDKAKVLNRASENLPFNIREYQKAKELLRMQYRYLDLRFPQMQFNLRIRSTMLMKMREYLVNYADFVDVETPTLFKATPGGAQEFVVPTRFPGQFYSLVQSPQQFKQILMAGAIDRYFQIARCYRDEGSRPDRQPEFTQLDIEMSFTNVDGVIKVVEDLLRYAWPSFHEPLPLVFPRMSYQQAMEKYGTDKPDLRFGYELTDTTDILQPVNVSGQSDFYSTCLIIDNEPNYTSSIKEKLKKVSQDYPDVKFVQAKVKSKEEWIKKFKNLLKDDTAAKFYSDLNLKEGKLVFLGYGSKINTLSLLGKIRLQYVNMIEEKGTKIRKNGMHLVWVTDFPLFEQDISGNLTTVHHPFTSPHPDDLHLLETSPLDVRSLAYDLVLNGNEIGGGSIRIHDPILQAKIFNMLSIDKGKMQHILDMLGSGCPPHGGIALGLDRLLAVVLGTQSIRDIIAFPKTFEGRDPISGAPAEISDHEKKLYHIKSTE